MNDGTYYLSWRGRQTGPYSREEIAAQLRQGEISGIHLVCDAGAWVPVEEFLAAVLPVPAPLPVAPRMVRKMETPDMADRVAELEAEIQRHASPPPPPQYAPPAPQWAGASPPQRISALAVVAFIFSLTSWLFLFLWPLAAALWLLSIIFGHTASSDCLRKPGLTGRGLAIAALAISYLSLLLFVALVFVLRSLTL